MLDDRPRSGSSSTRIAIGVSCAAHTVGALLIVWFFTVGDRQAAKDESRTLLDRFVWLPAAEPGARGGAGGGDRSKVASRARALGNDAATVPPPSDRRPSSSLEEPPPELSPIPAVPLQAGAELVPGALQSVVTSAITRGPGSSDRAGDDAGTGIGGRGRPGVDAGPGGPGDGGAGPGGASTPQLVRDVTPTYTTDAMRAKVQGAVLLECVVVPDGTVDNCRVLRSLDRAYGLDDQAVMAAKQWRFKPAQRFGTPVAARITIEMMFNLR